MLNEWVSWLIDVEGIPRDRAHLHGYRLREELEKGAAAISTPPLMPFEFKTARAADGEVFVISGSGHSLSVGLTIKYRNSLDNSSLGVVLWRGFDPWTQSIHFGNPEQVTSRTYRFDLSESGDPGWRETTGERRFLTNAQVVDHALKLLLEHVEPYRVHPETPE